MATTVLQLAPMLLEGFPTVETIEIIRMALCRMLAMPILNFGSSRWQDCLPATGSRSKLEY